MSGDGVQGPRQVVEAWLRAFLAADVEAVVGLYADDVRFFGTTGDVLVSGQAGVRQYFERALRWARPVRAELLEQDVQVLGPGVVSIAAQDAVAWDDGGTVVTSLGRVSFVLQDAGQGWRIAHFHRSALPGAAA